MLHWDIEWKRYDFFSLVTTVLFIITFAYLTFVYEIIFRFLPFNLLQVANILISHFLVYQLYYNYLCSALKNPGIVPINWKPSNMEQILELEEQKMKEGIPENNKLSNTISYCRKCDSMRPPRAHHCTECSRCIMKFDHHCPWINNCVGFLNHKSFMLFLIYVLAVGCYFLFFFTLRLVFGIRGADEHKLTSGDFTAIDLILIVIQLAICGVTVLAIFGLFFYQIGLIVKNTTYVESLELAKLQKVNGEEVKSIYDRGFVNNLNEVFGSNILYWPFPTPPEGDGMTFLTSDSLKSEV